MEVGNRIISVNDVKGIRHIHAELSKHQEMGIWTRRISNVDAGVQAAGIDVGIRRDWVSAGAPNQDPVITKCGAEFGGWLLIEDGTPLGTLYVLDLQFHRMFLRWSACEVLPRLPLGGVVVGPIPGPWKRPIREGQFRVDPFDVHSPSPGSSLSVSSVSTTSSNWVTGRDDELLLHCSSKRPGRQPLPADTPRYNRLPDEMSGRCRRESEWQVIRNISTGFPTISDRLHVGEFVRNGDATYIRNREGRRTGILGSAVRMYRNAHYQGKNRYRYDGQLPLPLPSHCRVVCLDVREIGWSSLGSVAVHSLVCLRNIGGSQGHCTHTMCKPLQMDGHSGDAW